jgi:hypothetical protein
MTGVNVLPFIGVFFLAPDRREIGQHVDRRIDWAGGLLFTVGSVLLFFCLSQSISEPHGWRTPCQSLEAFNLINAKQNR